MQIKADDICEKKSLMMLLVEQKVLKLLLLGLTFFEVTSMQHV